MVFIKSCLSLALLSAVVLAEPALPGQNAYLPPNQGYTYSTPSIPFPPPTTPGYPVRPPVTPDYPVPPNTFRPPYPGPTGPPVTRPPPTYGPPVTRPPTYGPPPPPTNGGGDGHVHPVDGHVHMPGMPFDFEYAVKDDQYGNDYSHKANSNGDVVQGEYRVQLPDGRLQIVRYTADWATGFHADVQYEGQARFPDQQQPGGGYNYQQPTPSGSRPGY